MKPAKYITVFLSILLSVFLTLFGQAAYAGIAGHAQFVSGQVQIANAAGQTRGLQKGDAVHESDTVMTAKGASAQIKMRDGGMIAIRPDSKLKFDTFIFSGEQDGKEKSLFSLLRGGFRAITGLIGQKHKANYLITAAGSTIGIRGTDHETFLVVPGSELAATVPIGVYNKVNVGGTTLTTNKGSIDIQPNQMGFAATADQMPQLQPVNLNLFTAVPSPAMQSKNGRATGRESTVVDTSIQEQSQQNILPLNAAPTPPISRPITADRPTAPPITF